ncbi:dpse - suppressor of 3-like 1, putative [Ichthyophthirius multifiliis]|uniref:Dpse-suppressor of 3-like 1, putative n=1 Tax=Ichthyophthirius multifiliis TaxID=5932 RepID=G0QQ05_ICHMU|nr:dpse - suppressor of 3-like 1, putative [Ichthyophthirius multifiliis]EGR32704.1 dpse - suppressor of 3-like 1, putative [Ichthyophthirius multifiliis]|eukprot:XP_004036690.1 dpse - suppressor of 3-like 1, putative [Ichthyophthirius multifiliis]
MDFDIAIIDEIQQINNEERGSAWTTTLLGLKAKEIHLCGDSSAIDIVQNICKTQGDDFECYQYERMSELKVRKDEYKLNQDLKEGDCFICFSINDIFALQKKINDISNQKFKTCKINYCSIIYGRQPFEIKIQQADLFNSQQNKFLISTDAIGMGINLNIKRIVFTNIYKLQQNVMNRLDFSAIQQIAGRAGRYQENGEVCAFYQDQIRIIQKALNDQSNQNRQQKIKAAIEPSFDQILETKSLLEQIYPNRSFNLIDIFQKFAELSCIDDIYFYSSCQDMQFRLNLIQKYNLSLEDQYRFGKCPIRNGKQYELEQNIFQLYAKQFIQNKQCFLPEIFKDNCKLNEILNFNSINQDIQETIQLFENFIIIYEQYKYLSNIYGNSVFVDLNQVDKQKQIICQALLQIYKKNAI